MTAFVVKFVGAFLIAYSALVGAMWALQRNLMYVPDTSRPDRARAGLEDMRDVTLRTADGLELLAWYKPAGPGLPTVVYLHGNAGNIESRGVKVRPFLDRGLGMLLVEYRGYGGNPGTPSEQGLYADARAALGWLEGEGIGPSQVALYGESLGTGIAVRLASGLGPGHGLRALVLEAPYTSIAAVAQEHYFYLPARWLVRDRYDSLDSIDSIDSPLLVVHGERDRVVPFALGRKLFAAAPEPKQALWVPDGHHNDLHAHGGVLATVIEFILDGGRS